MAGGVGVSGLWETGSRAMAAAIGLGVALKFFKWLIEFAFRRMDVSRSQLGERLRHVEQELDAYREATMLMIGVVARLDANNPALLKVAQILRTTTPRATLELNELEARLNDIPGKEER